MAYPVRITVGITGASGSVMGLRLLERLAAREGLEVHLIVTGAGERTIELETGRKANEIRSLAHKWHPIDDIGASLAGGSFLTGAMAIVPCSIHTMSSIATGVTDNLLTRAADVVLKERRRLVLAVRESPLHLGHLRNLAALAEMGAIIAPPVPAFYANPKSVEDIVDNTVDRLLDLLGLPDPGARRWEGG
jgi:4-hydroxy-3-polyprenylbenzoate decarboxylase